MPNALAIQSPPLVAVWFGDLIRGKSSDEGLICAMKGFGYTPNVGFTPEQSPFVRFGKDADVSIDPKNINLKFQFDVLHDFTPGYHYTDKMVSGPAALKGEAGYEWIGGGMEGYFGPSNIPVPDPKEK
jgi:hypothetical protein